VVDLLNALGYEPHLGHLCEQHLRLRLSQHTQLVVPAASFNKKSIDESPIRCWLLQIELRLVGDNLESEVDLVDGDSVLASVVLLQAGQETLCEIEA